MDKNSGRYSVPAEEAWQPGSNYKVLLNYPDITSQDEIEKLEYFSYKSTLEELETLISPDYVFTAEDLCAFHEKWLGDIYPFAGKYRTVNMSKGDFPFAIAARIESLMNNFDKKYLQKYTPCNFEADKLLTALAVVHVELIIIHLFREGNGRLARLLAIKANQAGFTPLNFELIDQTINPENFDNYIRAIHAGHDCDYGPMKAVFANILEETIS